MLIVRLLAAAVAAAFLAGCGTTDFDVPPAFHASLTKPGAQLDRAAALSVVSSFRRANGLDGLEMDERLNTLAEQYAKAMAAADKLSHELGGRDLKGRLRAASYRAGVAGENIAAGQDTLMDVFGAWRASPGHRSVMLQRAATHFGIAAVPAPHSRFKIFWVMIVAHPEG